MKHTFAHVIAYLVGGISAIAGLSPAAVAAAFPSLNIAETSGIIGLAGAILAVLHSAGVNVTVSRTAPTAAAPAPKQAGFARVAVLGILIPLAIVTGLALNGCATLSSPAARPFEQSAVAAAVDAVVGTNATTQKSRAASIETIAKAVLAADTGTTTTLATFEADAAAKVAALHLAPGDVAAADLLLGVVDTYVNTEVAKLTGTAQASQVQSTVKTVMGWIIAECAVYTGS